MKASTAWSKSAFKSEMLLGGGTRRHPAHNTSNRRIPRSTSKSLHARDYLATARLPAPAHRRQCGRGRGWHARAGATPTLEMQEVYPPGSVHCIGGLCPEA